MKKDKKQVAIIILIMQIFGLSWNVEIFAQRESILEESYKDSFDME